MIVVMVLSLLIQNRLNSRFSKYSQVPLGLTGAEVANRMLQAHGIRDVKIVSIPGKLTDHYDPTTKTVNLSENVYFGKSVAAAAVAAHECGHVVQHATGYAWLRMKPNNKKTTAKLEQCRLDKVVRVLSTGKSWTFIDYDGRRGYVQTSSLEFFANDHTDFETGLLSVKGKTAGRETCNVRSRDEKHRILAEYPQGTPVTVFDVIEDFAQIDVCGWHCTINMKFLTMEKETASAD